MLISRPTSAREPRGPRAPGIVQMARLYRDPVGYLERCRERFGPVFRIDYPGAPPLAYVAEPELARQLYAHDRDVNRAGETRSPYLSPLVGETSLLCLEGEQWQRHRSLLAPPLHGDLVEEWRERIDAIAAAEVDTWPDGELELRPRMQAITLEVIIQLVFGVDDGSRRDRLRELLPALLDAVDTLVFGLPDFRKALEGRVGRLVPRNPVSRFMRVRERADAEIYAEIARRRADGDAAERTDLLSLLLLARDEDGEGLSDAELRDELVTMLTAGHETTATALAWTFERLIRHPEAMERLTAEVDGGEGTTYLDAVVKESLRVRPVVFDSPRRITEPIELGGKQVPAGWWVAPAIPLVHGAPGLTENPAAFDPGRFLGEEPPLRGWIPFGGGKRRCIGSRLAMLEMRTVIPAVLSRRRLEVVDPTDEQQRVQNVTLAPAKRARARVRPR